MSSNYIVETAPTLPVPLEQNVETSAKLDQLAPALAKAQAVMATAKKDSTNPHFGNKYADLASVWDACREPLTANGLSIVQAPCNTSPDTVSIRTILLHSSGQFISSTITLRPSKADPQGAGSAITYARRYALSAMVGVSPDDDDGNAASGRETKKPDVPKPNVRPSTPPAGPADVNGRIEVEIKGVLYHTKGIQADGLVELWKLAAEYDKLTSSKGAAKLLIYKEWGIEHAVDATRQMGEEIIRKFTSMNADLKAAKG